MTSIHTSSATASTDPVPRFEDTSTPVIMIGPGTGIAPFRAFLEERQATGQTGDNWLFFGEQSRAWGFYYEEELISWQRRGLLRLDLGEHEARVHRVVDDLRGAERVAAAAAGDEAVAHPRGLRVRRVAAVGPGWE